MAVNILTMKYTNIMCGMTKLLHLCSLSHKIIKPMVLPCAFDERSVMETHAQVSGAELKVRIEKALTTKEMQPAIDLLEELFRDNVMELPCWIEGVIVERLRNAGVIIKKNGGWYRCIAAYTLLPKTDELIVFERQNIRIVEDNTFEDENLLEQWFEIVNEAVSITINSISSEFK